MSDQGFPIVRKVRPPLLESSVERCGAVGVHRPPCTTQVLLRIGRRHIRDADEMHARCPQHLRDVHGAELASADQADTQWVVLPLQEFGVEAHAAQRLP